MADSAQGATDARGPLTSGLSPGNRKRDDPGRGGPHAGVQKAVCTAYTSALQGCGGFLGPQTWWLRMDLFLLTGA